MNQHIQTIKTAIASLREVDDKLGPIAARVLDDGNYTLRELIDTFLAYRDTVITAADQLSIMLAIVELTHHEETFPEPPVPDNTVRPIILDRRNYPPLTVIYEDDDGNTTPAMFENLEK